MGFSDRERTGNVKKPPFQPSTFTQRARLGTECHSIVLETQWRLIGRECQAEARKEEGKQQMQQCHYEKSEFVASLAGRCRDCEDVLDETPDLMPATTMRGS